MAFRSSKRRPLGIAYAEFSNEDDAQKAIKGTNNTTFKGRTIYAKLHVPFVPKSVLSPPQPGQQPEPEPELSSSNFSNPDAETNKPEASKDTIYIPKISHKVTDEHLRSFFKEYKPQKIYVFTEKKQSGRFFSGARKAALVTVNTETPLAEVIEKLLQKKLRRSRAVLKPAFVTKIEKVVAADLKRCKATKAQNQIPQADGSNVDSSDSECGCNSSLFEPAAQEETAPPEEVTAT